MPRVLVLLSLSAALLLTLPAASAAPPECVSYSPYHPNPVHVDKEGCEELQEYVCYQTLGRIIPYNCDQG